MNKNTVVNHSDKGIETLTQMGTTPEAWGLTPIKWETKLVKMSVWVRCPVCNGDGNVWMHPKHGMLSLSKVNELGFYKTDKESKKQFCPTCPKVKWTKTGRWAFDKNAQTMERNNENGWLFGYGQANGLVIEECMVPRQVGVPQWANGTKFDSRFGGGMHCALCSKAIPSGRFVPVNGKDAAGAVHGMWIGEDCARKFFGVKNFKDDQIINREAK